MGMIMNLVGMKDREVRVDIHIRLHVRGKIENKWMGNVWNGWWKKRVYRDRCWMEIWVVREVEIGSVDVKGGHGCMTLSCMNEKWVVGQLVGHVNEVQGESVAMGLNGYCELGIWVVDRVVGSITWHASKPVDAWYLALCASSSKALPISCKTRRIKRPSNWTASISS